MAALVPSAEIFRSGITLLAFVIAFYALVAKERKTPYMVHSVYSISFLLLFALGLSAVSAWKEDKYDWLINSSAGLVALSLLFVGAKLWREHNRHVYFRDDQLFLNLGSIRFVRSTWRKIRRKKKAYEHNPMTLPQGLIASLQQSPFLSQDAINAATAHHKYSPSLSMAACLELDSLIETDTALTDIAIRFLENNCFIQYACCSRHPLEWLLQLKNKWEEVHGKDTWNTKQNKIVLVDAYTPHFGFTDSIYDQRTNEAEQYCIKVVKDKKTFAGVHTAIAEAFNQIKKHDHPSQHRSPTLVIYEGCQALADLESHEQYRIFLRHVIPSERLWGGMFTLFVESSLSDENSAVLKSLTHVYMARETSEDISHE